MGASRPCLALFAAIFAAWLAMTGAAAHSMDPLIADLSRHLVAITTGFSGTNVLLFGAVDEQGDVVVVVRGPAQPEVVRRKESTR